jgi:hypothetical protein
MASVCNHHKMESTAVINTITAAAANIQSHMHAVNVDRSINSVMQASRNLRLSHTHHASIDLYTHWHELFA